MTAYYNENDPKAAAWLRELIAGGHIAPGDVDERSIEDVHPDDLRGYAQCHFFAGIGGWSLALRLAGWPDDRPVWTGSCPCQPFSGAGKGAGFDDPRHLWPHWSRLVGECRPPVVFGEQVAAKAGLAWLDLVQADMEDAGYAIGAVDCCAAGVGAPHWRQRLWFVAERLADSDDTQRGAVRVGREDGRDWADARGEKAYGDAGTCGEVRGLADTLGRGQPGARGRSGAQNERTTERRVGGGLADAGRAVLQPRLDAGDDAGTAGPAGREARQLERGGDGDRDGGAAGVMGHPERDRREPGRGDPGRKEGTRGEDGLHPLGPRGDGRTSPLDGFWRDVDWLHCTDGKWRPAQPGTFPLSDGVPERVGLLRGYGNAIVPQVAAEVIGAYVDVRG